MTGRTGSPRHEPVAPVKTGKKGQKGPKNKINNSKAFWPILSGRTGLCRYGPNGGACGNSTLGRTFLSRTGVLRTGRLNVEIRNSGREKTLQRKNITQKDTFVFTSWKNDTPVQKKSLRTSKSHLFPKKVTSVDACYRFLNYNWKRHFCFNISHFCLPNVD